MGLGWGGCRAAGWWVPQPRAPRSPREPLGEGWRGRYHQAARPHSVLLHVAAPAPSRLPWVARGGRARLQGKVRGGHAGAGDPWPPWPCSPCPSQRDGGFRSPCIPGPTVLRNRPVPGAAAQACGTCPSPRKPGLGSGRAGGRQTERVSRGGGVGERWARGGGDRDEGGTVPPSLRCNLSHARAAGRRHGVRQGCRQAACFGTVPPGPPTPSVGQGGPGGGLGAPRQARPALPALGSPCRLLPLVLAQAGGGEVCGRTTGAKALFCFTAEIMLTGEKEKTPVGVEALVPDGRVMEEAPSGGLAGMTAGRDPLRPGRAGDGASLPRRDTSTSR